MGTDVLWRGRSPPERLKQRAAMSLDWDGYVSHKNASEGWMRAKLPWTAMRLNNSQTALMKERAEGFAAKSESDTGKGAGSFKQKDLELFHASAYQVASCFKGYDKITTNPKHGTLAPWNPPQETFNRLRRGY